jgi:hypothetical protein
VRSQLNAPKLTFVLNGSELELVDWCIAAFLLSRTFVRGERIRVIDWQAKATTFLMQGDTLSDISTLSGTSHTAGHYYPKRCPIDSAEQLL